MKVKVTSDKIMEFKLGFIEPSQFEPPTHPCRLPCVIRAG